MLRLLRRQLMIALLKMGIVALIDLLAGSMVSAVFSDAATCRLFFPIVLSVSFALVSIRCTLTGLREVERALYQIVTWYRSRPPLIRGFWTTRFLRLLFLSTASIAPAVARIGAPQTPWTPFGAAEVTESALGALTAVGVLLAWLDFVRWERNAQKRCSG